MKTLDRDARRRFGRQIRLPEIGEAGQVELCRTSAHVAADGPRAAAERVYLAAAGVNVVDGAGAPDAEVDAALDALALESEEAREVAEGALRALRTIRAVLGVGPAPSPGG